MAGSDVATGALAGAGTGAAVGSAVPVIGTAIGAGVGAVAGGLVGWFSGREKDQGRARQEAAIQDARRRMQEMAVQQRAQREADLQRALSYFEPVQAEMGRLYGTAGAPRPQPSPTRGLEANLTRPSPTRGLEASLSASPYFKPGGR